jgi:ABC-type multidrug transport system fused ATPase/permease subunit
MWYTGTQYIVRAMLKNKGIDPASITEVPQPVIMAPFVRGEVSVACVTVFNELQTLISEGVGDLVLFDPADYGIVIPRDTIVTTDKMLKERPDVAQRFLRASLRGWKYAIENQPEAVEITLKQNPALKKDHQTIMMREVAKLMLWGPSKEKGVGYLDPKTAEFSMTFLLDNKQLSKPCPSPRRPTPASGTRCRSPSRWSASGVADKLTLRQVAKTFAVDGGSVPVLQPFDLSVADGEFVTIVGPSGCGKSTLFNIVAGLLPSDDGGRLLIDGRAVTSPLGQVAYMPQRDLLFPWRTVLDNAVIGWRSRGWPAPKPGGAPSTSSASSGSRASRSITPSRYRAA